jgi:hypothetical protein
MNSRREKDAFLLELVSPCALEPFLVISLREETRKGVFKLLLLLVMSRDSDELDVPTF